MIRVKIASAVCLEALLPDSPRLRFPEFKEKEVRIRERILEV